MVFQALMIPAGKYAVNTSQTTVPAVHVYLWCKAYNKNLSKNKPPCCS